MKVQFIRKAAATAAVAVLVGIGAVAQPAAAGRYAASGSVGYVGLPTGTCTYYNAWNRLDVKVPVPAIYAADLNAGGGNDAAWARYQVYVVDRYGKTVRTSNFSGWAVAYDNRPAAFSGTALTFTNIPEFSTVHIGVEWSAGGYAIGAGLYRLDRYVLYSGGMGPYVAPDSCSKWTWAP
jgi:hypothetical protein